MWLDVLLFATAAFAGSGEWLAIVKGTAISRFIVSCFAAPLLWAYLSWQNRRWGTQITRRPVLAILKQFAQIKEELTQAQQEIERRKQAERALRESEERLRALASTDALTGVANRRFFWEAAQKEIHRSRRHLSPLSMIMIDLDNFKTVNDTYGHGVGIRPCARWPISRRPIFVPTTSWPGWAATSSPCCCPNPARKTPCWRPSGCATRSRPSP